MTAVVSKLLRRTIRHYQHGSFEGRRVVVTGGAGAIGRALIRGGLPPQGGIWSAIYLPMAYDAIGTDILNYDALRSTLEGHKADVVIHAAANKHAPEGEVYPFPVADLNIRGTEHVVNACRELGIETLVFLSTCKAAQPETVYGASKLVGERIILNAGGTVARLYNVVESSRNVFKIWEDATAKGEPCQVVQARRRFTHLGEAREFILSCCERPPGRYVPYSESHWMGQIHMNWLREHASANTGTVVAPLRRGDREIEPIWAKHEFGFPNADGSYRVTGPHD